MTITRDTPWRGLGRVPYAIWKKRITDAGGLTRVGAYEVWQAAGDDSALMLEMLEAESSYASNFDHIPAYMNDPWNLQIDGEGIQFGVKGSETPADIVLCVKAWRERMYSRTYKNGVYAKTTTIQEMINEYAPESDGNKPKEYAAGVVDGMNRNGFDLPVATPSTPEEPVIDTSKLVTGRVPHPVFIQADVSKPSVQSGYGYDTVAARQNVGCCWHEWQGSGNESIEFVKKFFGPNGERYTNALVDYAIMRDSAGTIVRLNNPRGTRSPWASGGGVESGGLEGDGPAFYNKFGLGAINAKLVSTEIVKSDSQNYTDAQIESAARLAAYWHDQDGQYYFEHPYTTKYGIVTSFLHFEFGTTSCGEGELDDITKVQARTRAIMQQYQEGAAEQPPDNPPDVPDLPDLQLPAGIPLAKAKERFGKLRKIDAKVGTNKLVATYEFDPKGVISLGWAQKCAEVFGTDYDKWPAAGDWIVFQEPVDKNTNDFVTFDGWDQNMLRKNEQQGFVWV